MIWELPQSKEVEQERLGSQKHDSNKMKTMRREEK